ncbi:DUF2793 domain-containing protein [Tropicimonas sp. IMCC34043]|uniref:DUF2793 domain-containing protein n=1 Tax=Tropicimonas sp. IMCC34043 TaxID=2248760 RepID=UPI0013004789|nr:DUF2793 domain-containing protein [Tropicimonas sp. IMCC34043]
MSNTASLGLPLIQPSQAQKHVTVNEALVRLDGLAHLVLRSRSLPAPPVTFADGDCYAVPSAASGVWFGHGGDVAIASGGGWIFVPPRDGWRGWIEDESCEAVFFGGAWQEGVLALSPNLAVSRFVVVEAEHAVVAGGAQSVALDIPANAMLFACSARVVEDLTGTASAWSLGLGGEATKFGTGMGTGAGSYCTGILSQPTTYYSAVQPLLSPVGGAFVAGRLRVAAHYYSIRLPD